MSTELELKEQLITLLGGKVSKPNAQSFDYSKLLDLSEQIAKHDKNNVRFTVDAKIVERLGEQLVSKRTTALTELIKNSYDADATSVRVNFVGTEQEGGEISLFDNGAGMSRENLVNGFMKISTPDKDEHPTSPKFSRQKAGRKGIGRFSAQKLAEQLTIITKRQEDTNYLKVEINWEEFAANTSVNFIPSKIESSEDIDTFECGTKLIMARTREAWTEHNILTSYNYLSNILTVKPDSKRNDPGFDVTFSYQSYDGKNIPITLEPKEQFLNAADVRFEAEVRNENVYLTIFDELGDDLVTTYELPEHYDYLLESVNYKLTGYYFSMGKGKSTVRYLQAFLTNNGGIRLFRNKFNVAPYGERYNDWLGLDESSRRRVILPPHANTNFYGHVSLDDDQGVFEETSAREGVIESPSFEKLQKLTRDIVIKVATHNAEQRGRKVKASQKDYKKPKPLVEQVEEKVSNLKAEIEKVAIYQSTPEKETLERKSDNSEIIDNTSTGFEQAPERLLEKVEELDFTVKEFINEQMMHRVLASIGLAISEFTHEIQLYLSNLKIASHKLNELTKGNDELSNISSDLNRCVGMLDAYTDFFDGTIRSNSNRERQYFEIRQIVSDFFEAMKPTIERRGYELEVRYDDWDIWLKPLHISELMSVLINMFTNACKAIDRAKRQTGKILFDVSSTSDWITIRFEDNGDGIPESKRAQVFMPLYTTEVPAKSYASDNEYGRGMGLGLSITEQIIDELDGEITVVEPSEGYNTCIQILLPRAKQEEIPEDAY